MKQGKLEVAEGVGRLGGELWAAKAASFDAASRVLELRVDEEAGGRRRSKVVLALAEARRDAERAAVRPRPEG